MKNWYMYGVGILALLSVGSIAHAQTRPTTSPTYIPQGVLATQTFTAATITAGTTNSVPFQVNGDGVLYMRLSGTLVGLNAVVQVSEFRGTGVATWTTVPIDLVGGPRASKITAAGLYRVNVSGLGQVRVQFTALTSGTVTLTQVGGAGADAVRNIPVTRATYSAAVTALTPAASATDFLTLTGSATATVRVTSARCTGIATAVSTAPVLALRRSTANAAGTSLASAIAPNDSNNPTASALPQSYTANPGALGTAAGTLRSAYMQLTPAATTTFGAQTLEWRFGDLPGTQEIVLRGATQVFALNGNAASFPAGTALTCSLEWTED